MRAQEFITEKWSEKYKRSINCNDPKGFSQKAHCAGREKNEGIVGDLSYKAGYGLGHVVGRGMAGYRAGKEKSQAQQPKTTVTPTPSTEIPTSQAQAFAARRKAAAQAAQAAMTPSRAKPTAQPSDPAKGSPEYFAAKRAAAARAAQIDMGRSREKNKDQELGEDLKKWFREKWVRFNPQGKIMGPCARGSDKEGKPKCLPQAKAHALGKKGRASAAARKRREDPNPERSGAAKNVATKKK